MWVVNGDDMDDGGELNGGHKLLHGDGEPGNER